jgi:hypothetical protein
MDRMNLNLDSKRLYPELLLKPAHKFLFRNQQPDDPNIKKIILGCFAGDGRIGKIVIYNLSSKSQIG